MTELAFKRITPQLLADRLAALRAAVAAAGHNVESAPAVIQALQCSGCLRGLDLTEEEPIGWSSARADEPHVMQTTRGEVSITGWVDFCAQCKLKHRLERFRVAIRGAPPPAS